MSEMERAEALLKIVPEYKIGYVIAYLQGLIADETDMPNDETLDAMQELENGGGEVFDGSAEDFLKMMLED